MNKEVIIIPTAEKALKRIKKFILDNHTQKEFDKLKIEIERILKQLEIGNVDYKHSKSTNTYLGRVCVYWNRTGTFSKVRSGEHTPPPLAVAVLSAAAASSCIHLNSCTDRPLEEAI